MMWFLLLLLCTAHVQPLIAQDENSIILKDGSNPCEGYIAIYHNNTLGYVGVKNWSTNNDKVVCKSTHCGLPNSSSTMTTPTTFGKCWLNEVNCTGEESNLWDCAHPGLGRSPARKDSLQKIKCSYEIVIGLDGFECAGAVQYSTNGGKTYSGYFCSENWGTKEADLLCTNRKCGTSKVIVQEQWMGWKGFDQSSTKMAIKCGSTNFTHLWQCARKETTCKRPASVICTGHERVQLKGNASNVCSGQLQKEENGVWKPVQNNNNKSEWCKQMHCGNSVHQSQDDNGTNLTCSGNVKVVLKARGKISRCYGSVYVEVNNKSEQVCATNWSDKDAAVVCSELNCGSVFSKIKTKINSKGLMDNVRCSGTEASLWHCRAKRDYNPFPCTSTAYVVCADSIKVELMDGPERCAGRVEIQHEGTWRRVSNKGWTKINSDIVCGQLGCGKERSVKNDQSTTNLDKFSQGSGEFLANTVTCQDNAKNISDCIKNIQNDQAEKEAIAITCEEHKVVVLKGNKSCSGMVGIGQGNNIFWLSGSNTTWNLESANTVCQQMHCGEASSHISKPSDDMMKSIWTESYSCSSKKKSLFHCKKNETRPSDHNDTIAIVTCSGNITVRLANECWGNVQVCLGKDCGGVCADTWTEEKSKMLCENLGCGGVLEKINTKIKSKESPVIFKSVHLMKEMTSLTQGNFIRSDDDDKTCNHNPAYVVCSGSVASRISDSRDNCSGNVEVRYEDQWLPVCTNALGDNNTQNTICEELGCGQASKKIDYFGPKAAGARSVSQIQCSANSKSLKACSIISLDKSSDKSSCDRSGLQCSAWSKMALTVDKACSGTAIVDSQGKRSAIAFEGWTEAMGEKLCKHLQCGTLKKNTSKTTLDSVWSTSFSCTPDILQNVTKTIWDCGRKDSNESQSKEQLFLQCQDEPRVTLSKKCYGEVRIKDTEVCESHWKETDSKLVCEQKNCGNAIGTDRRKLPIKDKDYYHVSCEANHYELGQCKRFLEKCESKLVSVYCDLNITFSTTEYCGGQIEVTYRGNPEKVCPLSSSLSKQKLCEHLNCSGYTADIPSKYTDDKVSLETQLRCTDNSQNIKDCLRHESCGRAKPAEIYCNGYVPTTEPPKTKPSTPIWPAILAVGFALVLLILIVVFIRICMVKKAKKGANDLPGMLSGKEVEIESGSYDDVMSKSNEMEELNHGRFRSESEVVTENDARSTSSFPYDDIDDPAVAQPLISRAATDGASGGDCIQNGATYEVDDQQDSYEDIEDSPEITRTEAEVHDSTRTAPESDAAAPLGSVQGDEDYLVPRRVSQN